MVALELLEASRIFSDPILLGIKISIRAGKHRVFRDESLQPKPWVSLTALQNVSSSNFCGRFFRSAAENAAGLLCPERTVTAQSETEDAVRTEPMAASRRRLAGRTPLKFARPPPVRIQSIRSGDSGSALRRVFQQPVGRCSRRSACSRRPKLSTYRRHWEAL
jgi:hypothetical protein